MAMCGKPGFDISHLTYCVSQSVRGVDSLHQGLDTGFVLRVQSHKRGTLELVRIRSTLHVLRIPRHLL